jgi:hypothetical protein
VQTAGLVAAVNDGSPWTQGVVDTYRRDAVRVLDFPHALEHLTAAAQASYGAGTLGAQTWWREQAHALKHRGPTPVLAALRALPVAEAPDPAAAAATQAATLGSLEARLDELRYPEFLARGLPLGDGAVESANKLVIEARLKGSGMHWARPNVNPLVALRAAWCSGRWAEAWPAITARLRQQARARRQACWQRHHPQPAPIAPPPPDLALLRSAARKLRARRPGVPARRHQQAS